MPARLPVDFCPVCKRDIHPPEPPFDMGWENSDNHVERCVHGSKRPTFEQIAEYHARTRES